MLLFSQQPFNVECS